MIMTRIVPVIMRVGMRKGTEARIAWWARTISPT
jgi:hypothetical protein